MKPMVIMLMLYKVNQLFVLFLFNIPVNSYGHVGTVTLDFVGHLPYI